MMNMITEELMQTVHGLPAAGAHGCGDDGMGLAQSSLRTGML